MDQKIAILGPKSWVHLWLDLGFRISKLAMRGGGKKKSVCCWKIWVRLIKRNKRRADHMRGSTPRPLSSVQLFHLRECERAAICWRAGFRQHKAAWNLSRDLYLFIPITLIHIHGSHSHYAVFFSLTAKITPRPGSRGRCHRASLKCGIQDWNTVKQKKKKRAC